ncbi:MAG: 23S rRNA (guanosine(2251)-2'-O)-methyltransferase RlmB [Firmicutes bacterium]|nr:23S rRNA (guanosine(2251)-2'-O)-methyltransferase RlmB [Bacillota bacterium]
MKIEGKNAVLEALKSGTTIDKLIVQKGLKDPLSQRIIDEAKSKGIRVSFYEKTILDKESSGKHQGFLAEVTDFNYSSVDEILNHAKQKDKPPFIVILDGVEDPHNLGSILRVAECAGVDGVIIPKHRSASINSTVIKVSAGAAAHVKVAKVTNISDTIESLKKQNIWVYCADMGGSDLYKADLKGAVALVIGGEDKGIGDRVKKCCDGVVAIPLKGQVSSLNASVATGIVVFEKLRQESF